jgi:MFS family permease
LSTPAGPTPPNPEPPRTSNGGAAPNKPDAYAALRVPDYLFYSISSVVGVIGGQVTATAIGYELYVKTGDARAIGFIGLARAVPVLLFALPGGQLADWFDRRRLLMLSQFLSALCMAGMAAVAYAIRNETSLPMSSQPIVMMYVLLFLRGVMFSFGGPARSALLPQIVAPNIFANAVSWNGSLFHLALVIGPVLGGFVILHSFYLSYAIDAATLLLAVMFTFLIRHRSAGIAKEPASLQSLLAGARFVWNTKVMFATMSLDLFAVLLGSVTALLPIYAKDILQLPNEGKEGLGWLRAAPAIGSFITAICFVHMPPMKKAGNAMLWMVAGFGAATLAFGASSWFWLSMLMLALTGAFDQVSVVVRHTLVQLLSPDRMRGRIAAVNNMFIGASNQLGDLRAGLAAWWLGPTFAVVSGGIGTLAVVAAIAMIFPQVRRIGALEDVKPESDPAEREKTPAAAG